MNDNFLKTFRTKNVERCSFDYKMPLHSHDGWSVAEWGNAIAGECGELCNLLKKIRRGDSVGKELEFHRAVADEMADIVTYIDLLAAKMNIDLEQAIVDKFNEVSKRIGSEITI